MTGGRFLEPAASCRHAGGSLLESPTRCRHAGVFHLDAGRDQMAATTFRLTSRAGTAAGRRHDGGSLMRYHSFEESPRLLLGRQGLLRPDPGAQSAALRAGRHADPEHQLLLPAQRRLAAPGHGYRLPRPRLLQGRPGHHQAARFRGRLAPADDRQRRRPQDSPILSAAAVPCRTRPDSARRHP